MKMTYGVIGLLIIGGLVFFLTSCNNHSKANGQMNPEQLPDSGKKETKLKENPYPGLRDKALSVTPEQLNLKLDDSKTITYGAVMDWEIGQAVVTVVTFQTGDASLYISTGQIFIGGIAHENIKKAALTLVREAKKHLSAAKLTTETPLPNQGCVRFYFLTNKGKYFIQETVENIENKKSDLTKLFGLGNDVISEYRTTTEK